MPILKQAFKRMRRDRKKHLANLAVNSELKTRTRIFNSLLSAGNFEEARKTAVILFSKLDKAASHGVIHKNTASRKKARVAQKINKLLPKAA
jgi:small subunit ribosomal protein S20